MRVENKHSLLKLQQISWRILFLYCLVILPAFILSLLLLKYSVNVPYMDQWDSPGMLFHLIHDGQTLTLDHFLSQHNESRLVFPRLVFLTLAYLTGWNTRYEMLITFFAACLISLNIYRLSTLTVKSTLLERCLLIFVANLLIFSPIQQENWLWGIQLIVFVPILCITSILLILCSNLKVWIKFLASACFGIISTFSYANGLLAWLVVLPALVFAQGWLALRAKRWFIPLWLTVFLANVVFYLHNFQKLPHHPGFKESFVDPSKAFIYFCSFLGSPLSASNLTISSFVGFLLIVLFTALCFYLGCRSRSERSVLNPTIVWFSVGFYSLLSGVLTTLGRVGFGLEQSLVSRYTTFSIYFTVSIIYLLVISVKDAQNNPSFFKNLLRVESDSPVLRSGPIVLLSVVLTGILVFHCVAFVYAKDMMQASFRDRLYSRSCLTYINYVGDDCISSLYPTPDTPRRRANMFNEMSLIHPPLAKTAIVHSSKRDKGLEPGNYGFIDSLTRVNENTYAASGWAALPNQKRSADSVLFTYKNSEGKDAVFTIAPVKTPRKDIVEHFNDEAYLFSGWTISFSIDRLPPGELQIQAWAFNSETGDAYNIQGSQNIQH